MRSPSARSLPNAASLAARDVAHRLDAAGHQAWLVGGTVRDLALGVPATDLDLATDATPDEVEALFPGAVPVGKAFGTVVVPTPAGPTVEVTTFRSESVYSDGRRPDSVEWGTSVAQDAERRDFTCNALYLDPLTDRLEDPTGGFADLEAGRLRCVGDPTERFREDSLRLLRLARFAGAYELAPGEAELAAARAEAAGLARIAPERVLHELEKLAARPGFVRAYGAVLDRCDLLRHVVPDWPEGNRRNADLRAALPALAPAEPLGVGVVLALLFDPWVDGWPRSARRAAEERLERLRPSRVERTAVAAVWAGLELVSTTTAADLAEPGPRASALRMLRSPVGDAVLGLASAWPRARAAPPDEHVRAFLELASEVPQEERFPDALLTSDDLAAAGVARGPQWGDLLREAEDLQLAGVLPDRAAALAWLAERARE